MRLIDADKMSENLVWCKEQSGSNDSFWDDVIERLDVQPTVDAVPVRRGRWIDTRNPQWPAYDIRNCSVCGWKIHKSKLRTSDLEWKYCPNCGADMREGENDG